MALKDHKDVLIAWINGEILQYRNSNGTWSDCVKFREVTSIRLGEFTYRIKPKEIVTTTYIQQTEGVLHSTHTNSVFHHNIKLTWSPDGETLLKAEVI
jgi:hypothetical protein